MKRTIMYFALAMGIVTANAQENKSVKESNGSDLRSYCISPHSHKPSLPKAVSQILPTKK